MPRVRTYRTVDAGFLDAAPVCETLRQAIPASAGATFATLEDADAWPVWLVPVDEVVWTSPRPFGVGTTRDITGKLGTISELFFAWEAGKRMSFCFTSGRVPGLVAFAEDYEVVPTGSTTCELVWRHAFEFAGAYRAMQPVVAFGFKRTCARSLRKLAAYMAERADRGV